MEVGPSSQLYVQSGGEIVTPLMIEALDSPGTTSATTYNVSIKRTAGTGTVSWPYTSGGTESGNLVLEELMV